MTPLHQIGNFLRETMMAVPLPWARVLFIAVPAVLLLWVLLLPRGETSLPSSKKKDRRPSLKIWAALALVIQIVIYSIW
jgi:hypothetical protein